MRKIEIGDLGMLILNGLCGVSYPWFFGVSYGFTDPHSISSRECYIKEDICSSNECRRECWIYVNTRFCGCIKLDDFLVSNLF